MLCNKCKNAGHLVVFDSFQYYYCPECKEEILLEEPPVLKYLYFDEVNNITAPLDDYQIIYSDDGVF